MKSTDIIVIGGGIAGISLASLLAEHTDVIVLEAESHPGYHSTSRSAAMFVQNYGNHVLRQLNKKSSICYQQLKQDTGMDFLLARRGELAIAAEHEVEDFDVFIETSTGIEIIDAKQAKQLCPALREEKIAGAAIDRSAADIDVDRLMQFYLRKLKSHNGEIQFDSRVESLSPQDTGWKVIAAEQHFSAKTIVNAAGAWADELAILAGITPLGLTPMRRSAALINPIEYNNVDAWPLIFSVSESWYAKPQSGLLIVSPAEEDPVTAHDVWPEDFVLAQGIDRFQQYMDIEVKRIEHSWAGLRTFTKDRQPLVGFVEENFFWLAGQGGYGIQTAPVLAQLSADLILNRQPNISDSLIQELSPNRFLQD